MEKDIKNLSEIIFNLKQEIYELMKEYYDLSISLNPNKNSFDELCEILIGEVTVDETNPINIDENKKKYVYLFYKNNVMKKQLIIEQ